MATYQCSNMGCSGMGLFEFGEGRLICRRCAENVGLFHRPAEPQPKQTEPNKSERISKQKPSAFHFRRDWKGKR